MCPCIGSAIALKEKMEGKHLGLEGGAPTLYRALWSYSTT